MFCQFWRARNCHPVGSCPTGKKLTWTGNWSSLFAFTSIWEKRENFVEIHGTFRVPWFYGIRNVPHSVFRKIRNTESWNSVSSVFSRNTEFTEFRDFKNPTEYGIHGIPWLRKSNGIRNSRNFAMFRVQRNTELTEFHHVPYLTEYGISTVTSFRGSLEFWFIYFWVRWLPGEKALVTIWKMVLEISSPPPPHEILLISHKILLHFYRHCMFHYTFKMLL